MPQVSSQNREAGLRPPPAAPAGPSGAGRARRAPARVGEPATAVRTPRHCVPPAGVRGQPAAHVREQSLREPAPGTGLPVCPQTHLAHTDAGDTRAAECLQRRWREAWSERSRAVSRASRPARLPRLQRWALTVRGPARQNAWPGAVEVHDRRPGLRSQHRPRKEHPAAPAERDGDPGHCPAELHDQVRLRQQVRDAMETAT